MVARNQYGDLSAETVAAAASLHDELLLAVDDEVAAVERAKRSDTVPVGVGRFVGRADTFFRYSFDRPFIDGLVAHFDRRMKMSLSVVEKHLYMTVGEEAVNGVIHEHRVG